MGATGDPIRVLHVDDDPDLAALVRDRLEGEDEDIVVETVHTVEAGLARIDDGGVDCVVSDFDLPVTDGLAFLRAVRADAPDLPFILFTGRGSEEVASEAISAGVTDYIQKGSGTDRYALLANRVRNAVAGVRSARAASRRRHRIEQILKTVPACVVQIDPSGEFVYANRRAEAVLGLEPAEVVGRTYNDPEWAITDLEGEPIPDEALPFRRVFDTGEPLIGFRHCVEFPTGERKVLQVNGAPLFDEDGTVESTVFALSNVTDRHAHRLELERQNERLDEFASVVSHDLRSPLNVAQGHLDLATEECESEHLGATDAALGRMETLISDLLSLARAGRTVGETEPVALADVVEESFGAVVSERARLASDVDGTVQADPARLRQVFENLVRNAVQHVGEDVTVRVGELPDGFYVEDDGSGIPPDSREAVLEAGYSGPDGGTGIGLAIVRDVAQAHGWRVAITEGSDGGTRVEFRDVEWVA